MSFCSNKIYDSISKLNNLVTKINDNSDKIFEIKHKCLKMLEEINCLQSSHNINKQLNFSDNMKINNNPDTTN